MAFWLHLFISLVLLNGKYFCSITSAFQVVFIKKKLRRLFYVELLDKICFKCIVVLYRLLRKEHNIPYCNVFFNIACWIINVNCNFTTKFSCAAKHYRHHNNLIITFKFIVINFTPKPEHCCLTFIASPNPEKVWNSIS